MQEKLTFRTIKECCELFNMEDKYRPQRAWFRIKNDVCLWCPNLDNDKNWKNEENANEIIETNTNENYDNEARNCDEIRITFEKRKSTGYCYSGLYKIAKEKTKNYPSNKRVWERIDI